LTGALVYHLCWGPLPDEAGRLLGVLVSMHDLIDPADVWRHYRAQAAREPACYHWHGL
jgi:hypothetical protein